MEKYDLDFLTSKGLFSIGQIEIQDKIQDGSKIQYVFDPQTKLAYFDTYPSDKITAIVRSIKKKRNFDYYWFWKKNKVYCFRAFGENKRFVFNIEYLERRRKDEYYKSKIKKLREFSFKNLNVLFDVRDVVDRFYNKLWEIRIKLAKKIQNDLPDKVRILVAQRMID